MRHYPTISSTLNDGVVNTVRQIVNPGGREEVGGLVVADHAEVLGHYDRLDALIGGKSYNTGLFHSGVAFGDDEFFGLPASRAGYPEDGPRCAPRGGTARAGHRVDPARMIAQQGAAR